MEEFNEIPRVEVRLPRFEIEWEADLVALLRALGMEAPFSPAGADFSEMLGEPGAYISEVLNKTFPRVDERGAEAAAVTGVVMNLSSGGTAFTFDRPFFLAIWDRATETVLFLGQITDPTA